MAVIMFFFLIIRVPGAKHAEISDNYGEVLSLARQIDVKVSL